MEIHNRVGLVEDFVLQH